MNAEITSVTSPKQRGVISRPVTNESVEAGLLKIREALRSSPKFQTNDASTHMALAKIFNHQGDPNGAIEEYRFAIALNPSLAEAYRGLGAVYLDKHEWENAKLALEVGIQLDPQHSQSFYWLGRALIAQNHFSQASDAFDSATRLDPNYADAHSDLGLALMAQGHIHKAENALIHAIRIQPDLADAHFRLERVRAAQDDAEQIIQSAQHILHVLFRRE